MFFGPACGRRRNSYNRSIRTYEISIIYAFRAVAGRSFAGYCCHEDFESVLNPSSRLLKSPFFSNLRRGRGTDRHFSSTQVLEKWSEPRACTAAKRAEKVRDGLFQHTIRRHAVCGDGTGRRPNKGDRAWVVPSPGGDRP